MISAHRRSPVVAYLLVFATAGAYVLWWLHRTMRDLNAMAGRDIFGLRMILPAKWRPLLYSYFALICLVLLLGPRLDDYLPKTMLITIIFLLMCPLAVAWIGGIAYVHVRIARAIADVYDERALPGKPSPALAGVLFFAWSTAVPYLQSKMNRLAAIEAGHDTGVEADRGA